MIKSLRLKTTLHIRRRHPTIKEEEEIYGNGEGDYFTILNFDQHRSRLRDLGRPKQRWKDQEHLQYQYKQALMILNLNSSW